jgi:hypothetical protein
MMNMKSLSNAGRLIVLIGLGALILSGCSLFQTDSPKVCPRVSLLNEAAKITQYRDGPGRDLIDVRFEARVHDVNWGCSYADKRLSVVANIDIVAQRGPAFAEGKIVVPFFVAIIDKDQNIIAKEQFLTEIAFGGARRRSGVREEIEQIVFLKENENGSDYEIIVGLQLNEQQLQQNRGRRF